MQPLSSPPLTVQAVSRQFATRPSLMPLIQTLLGNALRERYPSLSIDLALTHLAIPQATKGWTFQPLMDVIFNYLAGIGPLELSEAYGIDHYLSDVPPKRLKLPGLTREKLEMTVVQSLIQDLCSTLPIAAQDALAHYWNEPSGTGGSRWRWLSDMLMTTLQASALRQTDLDADVRQTLDQLIGTPDREQRIARYGEHAVYAYSLETQLDNAGQTTRVLSEQLLLTRAINGKAPVLLCSPGGRVEAFSSMDAFTLAWGERAAAQYEAETITCNRYEPEGSIFDYQATTLFNLQMERLAALKLPLEQRQETLQGLYLRLTDPGEFFLDAQDGAVRTLDAVRARLPDALRDAPPGYRERYRQYSLALATAKQRAGGRSFLTGIDDIHTYTVHALQQALDHEASAAGDTTGQVALHPDDLQLTFVVAAGYPGTVGIVERVHMSLTELALKNLAGLPSGELSIAHRQGTPLPAWLTRETVIGGNGLIKRVDIGKHYPELLKQALLSDTPQARERETLFAAQQPMQLCLLALELSLKGEAGITPQGARMVAALMQGSSAEQKVDGKPVVIRHLSFLRSPGAKADKVSAMYLIEFQNSERGPHLLYRPLYAQALQEFSSRAALFQAIAQPGELQTSLLTWLSDTARPIYDHGGFQEPHYLRFGQGDEFAPRRTPPPATFASDGANDELHQCLVTGRLMTYLFSDHSRALIEQAERESTSNSESRWQVLMEGGSLLFGSLLQPLLSGPSMMVGWLLALYSSLSQDIQLLDSSSATSREQGAIDLLLTVATLLLESPLAPTAPRPAVAPRVPQRRPQAWPARTPARIRQGTVALPGVQPQGLHTAVDFSYAQARYRLTPSQRASLASLKVPMPGDLPQPVLNGPRKGLYLIDNRWHAQVDSDLFRVNLEDDGSVRITDPTDAQRPGPYLRDDGQGIWSVDSRLRLRGGMPPKRIAAERERKANRVKALEDDLQAYLQTQPEVDKAEARQTGLSGKPLAEARQQYDAALEKQSLHQQQILDSLKEREALNVPLSLTKTLDLLHDAVLNARKHVAIAELDREDLYRAHPQFRREGPGFNVAVVLERNRYRQFTSQLADINERSIRWLERQARHLEHMQSMGSSGAKRFNEMTANRVNEISALSIKDLQLRTLKYLSVKDFGHPLFKAMDNIVSPLQQQVRTHAELNGLVLSSSDRLSVLESLVEHYGRALDGLLGLEIVDVEGLDATFSGRLLNLVRGLYDEVTQRLSREVRPIAHTSSQPPRPVPAQAPAATSAKRVIKTRRRGTLIGDVQRVHNVEVVEVRNENTRQVVESYSQQGDVWVEYVVQTPPQAPVPPRSLSQVKGEARKLLAMLDDHLRRAEHYKKSSRHPQEVQEVLDYEAARYDKLATELDQAIAAQPESARTTADQALASDMRKAGERLSALGQTLRHQLSLELPPTHGNLEYLLNQRQVNVAKLGGRTRLKGERQDFIQEYAINDPKGYPVWYAHFHYPTADTAGADYTAAHVKTREQRKQSYYSLLAKAQGPQAVVDVHRGLIGKALAQRWFLSFP
ncbi:hypothetical protein N0U25_24565 [Pseudomonas sivasensis]|uniref:hypothetical protein n=1 Tax=Pseudomonas sivasensis TaxID=1880678 RepID=UPI0021AA1323|nr:hypothetical protein [Pseudomonas sivasensis]MCT4500975.1 hypothetical protein [Pseudomonas sivasensis]